jgi:hypothetical protein
VRFPLVVSFLALLVAAAGAAHAGDRVAKTPSLLSVTFDVPNSFGSGGPVPVSGPDPSATAANPLFGQANVWNHLPAPFGVLVRNPRWSQLVDSSGRRTHVRFVVRGTVLPVNLYPYSPSLYAGNTLRSQFLAWNSWNGPIPGAAGPGESKTIWWMVTGLEPRARYAMFVYGAIADNSRSFDMRIQGVTKNVPTYAFGAPLGSGGAYFANLRADRQGRIWGLGIGVGDDSTFVNEANWVGFQLARLRPR